jgi:hypothetical protein
MLGVVSVRGHCPGQTRVCEAAAAPATAAAASAAGAASDPLRSFRPRHAQHIYTLCVCVYNYMRARPRARAYIYTHRVLRPRKGPRLAIFGQTCNQFSPQYNSETAGLLTTKSGMALGIHLKNLAHVMRPRPSASVVALATLERRGGCGNFFCVINFRPTTTIALLGCGTSERNGLARKDMENLAQASPLPGHQSVTHLRGAKGDCFGGAVGAKTKSFSIERPISPKTAQKRPLPGPHGPS